MSVKVVNSGGGTVNVKVETTPTISVSNPEVKVVDVNRVCKRYRNSDISCCSY